MSFYKPIHFLFGEYIFETDEKNFPRFANLLVDGSLNFWGSEYIGGKVKFHASLFSAEQIVAAAKEIQAPLELVEKKGLPFFFSRYRKRYGLLAGMAIGLFLIFFSQLFVWKINITGNVSMNTVEIEKALADCGITLGSFIPNIDAGSNENRLLLDCKELSSVSISIGGTHVNVAVLERTPLPDVVDTEGFYNVVATRDGTILDMDAADGTPEVQEGDVVYEGELLINSFMERENGTFRPTHARGNVFAAVKETFEIEIPFERVTKSYSGKTETKTTYNILGFDFHAFRSEYTDYEYFDATVAESDVKLFGFIDLPIKKTRTTYAEYVPSNQTITAETAEALAYAELKNLLKEYGGEVIECETDLVMDEENGICRLTANTVLKVNIAKEVELDINQNISDKLPKAVE